MIPGRQSQTAPVRGTLAGIVKRHNKPQIDKTWEKEL